MAWGGSDELSCFGSKGEQSDSSCHDGASHGCHMLRRLLGLVLVIAAHGDQPAASAEGSPESVAAGGISNAQQAELHRLLQATARDAERHAIVGYACDLFQKWSRGQICKDQCAAFYAPCPPTQGHHHHVAAHEV